MDKSVPLTPLGVKPSVGAMSFIPAGFPHAGKLKLMSHNAEEGYTATLKPDGKGLYDVAGVQPGTKITGKPKALLFVPPGSPKFSNFKSVVVGEWFNGVVAAYDIDANGDPIRSTRRLFMTKSGSPTGAAIDPVSGDFLFSVAGPMVLSVRGFGLPCGHVERYGRPTPGSGNVAPVIDARGCFARSLRTEFTVSKGLGGARGVLVAGVHRAAIPIVGIILHVRPALTLHHALGGSGPGNGTFRFSMVVPDDINLINTDFFLQGVYLDRGAAQGVSATGGVTLRVR